MKSSDATRRLRKDFMTLTTLDFDVWSPKPHMRKLHDVIRGSGLYADCDSNPLP